ncbi:MAG: DUF4019 domain-containing protein [Gammaproteobacteria bacterium]|nr:DUF4019 domain-containing protein [Gammaproteobacteria bacterium]
MRYSLTLLILTLTLVGGCERVDDKRVVVARQWLRAIDHGEFNAIWESSADYFKGQLDRDEWFLSLERAIEERGMVKSRNLIGCSAKPGFSNGPDAEYSVCAFVSVYVLRPEGVVETVTLVRADHWKVIHYVVN